MHLVKSIRNLGKGKEDKLQVDLKKLNDSNSLALIATTIIFKDIVLTANSLWVDLI